MKIFKAISVCCLAAAALLSCSKGAGIVATISDAPDSDIVVKMLDVNKYKVLDTVRTDSRGVLKYSVPVQAGRPEFIYLFSGDDRIASLLLQKGEKALVSTDLAGNCSVSGSPESEKLLEVEKAQAEFSNLFASTSARLADLDPSSPAVAEVSRELTKQYISYYRSRVKYVLENSKSLTVIPVLYEVVGDNLPVFGQATDAIHFRNCCDSLRTVYPESRYLKALEDEAARRQNVLELDSRLSAATEAGFPDLNMPDIRGRKVRLSEVEAPLLMVYFWSASEAGQTMFNLDAIKPLYEDFHKKGLEIYAVSLDTDKTLWATTVRNQGSGWINVCDGLGAASPAVPLYNVNTLPTVFFIQDGSMIESSSVRDEASLKRFLAAKLK